MRRSLPWLLPAAAALLLPPLLPRYQQDLMIQVVNYGALATWWNLLGGFAGQPSLGNGLFLATGAYTSSLLFLHWGVTPWLGMLVGMAVAAVIALVLGGLVFRSRLRGVYFALATLVAAQVAAVIINNIGASGSSTAGIALPVLGDAPYLFQFTGKLPYYYFGLGLLVCSLAVSWRLGRSRTGLYWQALRENEAAAAALGVDVYRYKLLACVLSAAGTAASGTLQAQYVLYLDARTLLGFDVSLNLITFSILGGLGSVFGPLLGAVLLVPVGDWVHQWAGRVPGIHLVIYGLVLVLATFYLPTGLAGLLRGRRVHHADGRWDRPGLDPAAGGRTKGEYADET